MKNPSTQNTNTRVPARLVRNIGTKKKTAGIKNVQMYQNVITMTNLDMSKNIVGRKSGKKNQRTTRINITRRNAIIEK